MLSSGGYRLGIFVGFASFFLMEKTLRVLGSEDGHAHAGHSHSHSSDAQTEGKASGVAKNSADGELRSRGASSTGAATAPEEHEPEKTGKQPSKLSAYLNLFGDFVHNM